MASAKDFIAAADGFLATPKRLIGSTTPQDWQEGRSSGEGALTLKFPIEINGEQDVRHKLALTAYPNDEDLRFHIALIFQFAIFRLDFHSSAQHGNIDAVRLRLPLPGTVSGPHYHPWDYNKRLIRNVSEAFKLTIAVPLDENIRQFDSALRWFCAETNIELANHEIQLPPRTGLF